MTAVFVLAVTLFPYDFDFSEVWRPFDPRPFAPRSVADWLVNVALFLPLGFGFAALRPGARGVLAGLLASAALSSSVEVLQMFVHRHPGVADILTNVAGAGIGAVIERVAAAAVGRATRAAADAAGRIPASRLGLAAAVWTAVAFAASVATQQIATLDNWDPSYPLTIGNEHTGDRPWAGRVHRLWIAEGAAGPAGARAAFAGKAPRDALLADWRPDAAAGGDPPLVARGPGWVETERGLRRVTERLRAASAFTLFVDFETDHGGQKGPARIASISRDPYHRNLTLAQEGRDLVCRLRTPITGDNGERPACLVPRILAAPCRRQVLLSFGAGILEIRVDRSEPALTYELTPWTTRFGGIFEVVPWDLRAFRAVWYLIVFGPLGALLAVALRAASARRAVAAYTFVAAVLVAPVALEAMLEAVWGRPFLVENCLLGAAAAAFGLLAAALVLRPGARVRPGHGRR